MTDHKQSQNHNNLGDEIEDVKREWKDVGQDLEELASDIGDVAREAGQVVEQVVEDAAEQVEDDIKWATSKKTWQNIPLIQKFSLAVFGFSLVAVAAILAFGIQESQDIRQLAAPSTEVGRGRPDGQCVVAYYSNHSFIINGAPSGSPYAGNAKEDLGYISRNSLRHAFDQATVNVPASNKQFKDLTGQNVNDSMLANVDVLFVDDWDDGYDVVNNVSHSNPPADSIITAVRNNWQNRMNLVAAADNGLKVEVVNGQTVATGDYAAGTVGPIISGRTDASGNYLVQGAASGMFFYAYSEPLHGRATAWTDFFVREDQPYQAPYMGPKYLINTADPALSSPGIVTIVDSSKVVCHEHIATYEESAQTGYPDLNRPVAQTCMLVTVNPGAYNSNNGYMVVNTNAGNGLHVKGQQSNPQWAEFNNLIPLIAYNSDCTGAAPTATPTNTPIVSVPTATPTPTLPAATNTPVAGTCNGIGVNYGLTGEPSRPPRIGEAVTFSCNQITGMSRYEFRVIQNGQVAATLQPNAAGSRISQPFVIPSEGSFQGQCRGCIGADPSSCQPWP